MPLNEDDWKELCFVLAGALANMDIKLRAIKESIPPELLEEIAVIEAKKRKDMLFNLHRGYERTLLASHHKKTHKEMDLLWLERQMNDPDFRDDPPASS